MPPKKKSEVTEEGLPEVTDKGIAEATPAAPIEASATPAPETPESTTEPAPEAPTTPVEAVTESEAPQTPPPAEKSFFDAVSEKFEEAALAVEHAVERVVEEVEHPDFPSASKLFERFHGVKVQ